MLDFFSIYFLSPQTPPKLFLSFRNTFFMMNFIYAVRAILDVLNLTHKTLKLIKQKSINFLSFFKLEEFLYVPSMKTNDNQLLEQTFTLRQKERSLTHLILKNLIEIEKRKLYCDLKYSSLFKYLIKHLKYSGAEAQIRIQAMKLMRGVPSVAKKIEEGKISLTQACDLQRAFSQTDIKRDKAELLIEEVSGKSTRATQEILLKKFSFDKPKTVSVTLPEYLVKKLERLKIEYGEDLNEVELIDAVVEEKLKRPRVSKQTKEVKEVKEAKEAKQVRSSKRKTICANRASRYISVSVKNQVWKRDHGKCQQCEGRTNLQYEHIFPFARGGGNSVENLKLLCSSCNLRAGIVSFGVAKMEREGMSFS
jgi:5-methylcytosine-specific restriction endonuclease McrA